MEEQKTHTVHLNHHDLIVAINLYLATYNLEIAENNLIFDSPIPTRLIIPVTPLSKQKQ